MPVFFNRDSLTPEQSYNYERALQEYYLVQLHNALLEKNKLAQENKLTPELAKQIDFMVTQNKPDEKSALFHRILSGKQPLEFAPPTSFSYPWYEVVEENGPFEIFFGGYEISPEGNCQNLILNQCTWECTKLNQAAQELIIWHSQFIEENKKKTKQLDFCALEDWIRKSQAEIFSIFYKNPEFYVKFNSWSSYKVYIGKKIIKAKRCSLFIPRVDLDFITQDVKVLKVIESGQSIMNKEKKLIENLKNSSFRDSSLGKLLSPNHNDSDLPENYADWDWVEAEINGWFLSKA